MGESRAKTTSPKKSASKKKKKTGKAKSKPPPLKNLKPKSSKSSKSKKTKKAESLATKIVRSPSGANLSKASKKAAERRGYIRFPADPDAYALIDARTDESSFSPHIAALVVEESHGGVRLVFPKTAHLKVEGYSRISLGKQGTHVALLKWVREIAPGIFLGGFEFITNFSA